MNGETSRKKERERQKQLFLEKVQEYIIPASIQIIDIDQSDALMQQFDEWPGEDSSFVYQVAKDQKPKVSGIIEKLMNKINKEYAYLFLMNVNVGLIKVSKSNIQQHWTKFLRIDGEEFFIHDPDNSYFVSITLTDDKHAIDKPWKWIYELTFSSSELKDELVDKEQG